MSSRLVVGRVAFQENQPVLEPLNSGDGGRGGGRTAVNAPADDDPVGRVLEDIKRLSQHDLRRLIREIQNLLR